LNLEPRREALTPSPVGDISFIAFGTAQAMEPLERLEPLERVPFTLNL
jgi:hypothetical protein